MNYWMMNSNDDYPDQEPDYGPYHSREQELTDALLTLKAEHDNLEEQASLLVHELAMMKRATPKQQMSGWLGKWWKAHILRPMNCNYTVEVWLQAMENAMRANGLNTLSYAKMFAHLEAAAEPDRHKRKQMIAQIYNEQEE